MPGGVSGRPSVPADGAGPVEQLRRFFSPVGASSSSPPPRASGDVLPGPLEAAHAAMEQDTRSRALRNIGNLLLAGAAVGLIGRSAVGGWRGLQRSPLDPPGRSVAATLPVPVVLDRGRPKRRRSGFDDDGPSSSDKAASDDALGRLPWYRLGLALGAFGGLYAGWRGLDAALKTQRRLQTGSELEDAKRRFERALLAQYDRPVRVHPALAAADDDAAAVLAEGQDKSAAEAAVVRPSPALDRALDDVYDRFTAVLAGEAALPPSARLLDKSASWLDDLPGYYTLYAGVAALATAALVYDHMSRRSQRRVLESAVRQRRQQLDAAQPAEIYVRPRPVLADGGQDGR